MDTATLVVEQTIGKTNDIVRRKRYFFTSPSVAKSESSNVIKFALPKRGVLQQLGIACASLNFLINLYNKSDGVALGPYELLATPAATPENKRSLDTNLNISYENHDSLTVPADFLYAVLTNGDGVNATGVISWEFIIDILGEE